MVTARASETRMKNCLSAVAGGALVVQRRVNTKSPVLLGVPLSVPVTPFMMMPSGSNPLTRFQVKGNAPPLAAIVIGVMTTPRLPEGRLAPVVIVRTSTICSPRLWVML